MTLQTFSPRWKSWHPLLCSCSVVKFFVQQYLTFRVEKKKCDGSETKKIDLNLESWFIICTFERHWNVFFMTLYVCYLCLLHNKPTQASHTILFLQFIVEKQYKNIFQTHIKISKTNDVILFFYSHDNYCISYYLDVIISGIVFM